MTTNLAPLSGNLPAPPSAVGAFGAASPIAGASGGPRTSPIMRYLAALKRFKWLVLLLSLVGLGAGYVMSGLRPPSYGVRAKLLVSMPNEDGGPVSAGNLYSGDQWKQLGKSYRVIEPVVIARRLYLKGPKRVGAPPLPLGPSGEDADLFRTFERGPRYQPGAYELKITDDGRSWELTELESSRKEKGAVGDSVGRQFGFAWQPLIERRWYGKSFTFDAITVREAADDVNGRLGINLDWRVARFIDLSYEDQVADAAAGTLNDIIKEFVGQSETMKRANLTTQARVLDSQVTAAQFKLRDAERELLAFQTNTITAPREELSVSPGLQQTTPMGYSAFMAKRNLAGELKRDRKDMAEALAKIQNGEIATDVISAIPSVRSSPDLMRVLGELSTAETEVRDLRAKGTLDSYKSATLSMPDKLARIQEIRSVTIPLYARAVLRRLDDEIARTDGEVQSATRDLQDIPTRRITESRLVREKDLAENVYKVLTDRYQASRLKEASAIGDLSVFDPAEPPLNPTKNRKAIIILLGAFGGLGAGLGLALLFDLTDKRVRYADQITGGLGLTILGVIPEIKRAKGETPTAEEAAQVIEAFRTVRLNLSHTVGEGTVMLTISSPSPGDGKSLVSSNLSLSFAEAGYRTLLIDGDTRRGELHRTFGVDRRPGLLDHLTGELPLSELVRDTTHPQLKLVTAGSRKRNAPELLGGPRMRELLETMRGKYDVVIVDSPPLGAGIDPFVLGTLTGSLMLVMRAGATERDLAEAKLQIVDQLPIRLIGAVLNDVRATATEYKYYSYSYGYGAVEEGEEMGKLPPVPGVTA